MLYIILVFFISVFVVKIDSTLWTNVFEVMFSAYLTVMYEEMKFMKKNSHGVSSGKCVETNVIMEMYGTKINIDTEHWVRIPTTHQAGIYACFFIVIYLFKK